MYTCLRVFFENLQLIWQIVLKIWTYLQEIFKLGSPTRFTRNAVSKIGEESFFETVEPINLKIANELLGYF